MDSFNMDEKHMFSKMLYSIISLWWCHDVVCFSIYTNMYIIRCFVMMKPWGGYVFYTHVYIYIMILRWWDVMRTRWWLRSTTDSYGWPVIEIAYGETLIHSIEAVWEILAREKWLGCQHDASPMFDILGSTPVWAQYIYIFWILRM